MHGKLLMDHLVSVVFKVTYNVVKHNFSILCVICVFLKD